MQDLARVRNRLGSAEFRDDFTMFKRMVRVIKTGLYPEESNLKQPRTMSVKKRYCALLVAHSYLEQRFDAIMRYGRFAENAFLWHSFFHRLQDKFGILCQEICKGNVDLASVPMELLYNLDDKCSAYLSDFKQYSFASLDSPDSVYLPEIASPISRAAMYVDVLTKYQLINITASNVVRDYYERVMSYVKGDRICKTMVITKSKYDYNVREESMYSEEEQRDRRRQRLDLTWTNKQLNKTMRFCELAWTLIFPAMLRNRLVSKTCGRRIKGLDSSHHEPFNNCNCDDSIRMIPDKEVIKWRKVHEKEGEEYTNLMMTVDERSRYLDIVKARKMMSDQQLLNPTLAQITHTGRDMLQVNEICKQWDPSFENEPKSNDMEVDNPYSLFPNVIDELVDNDVINRTLTRYMDADGNFLTLRDNNYESRVGYPGAVDFTQGRGGDQMDNNIMMLAVQNAITSEQNRVLLGENIEMAEDEEDKGSASENIQRATELLPYYGFANKHQILTIESIFRYLTSTAGPWTH